MKRILTLCALAVFGICNMGQKAVVTDPVEKVATLDIAKATYTNIGGKLYVYTGKTATVKQYDSAQAKQVDVAVPKADTVKVEQSTDSTRIEWVNTAQYEVKIDKDMPNGYKGSFDARMGKAFWVRDIIGVGGKRRPSNAVIDYESGTYFVPGPLLAGEVVDPGYASAPSWIGPSPKYASGDSTRPLPDTTGDQIVFWFTGDTVKAGKWLNLINNDTGIGDVGVTVSAGYVGRAAQFSGTDSIVWADQNLYDISGQATIMTWAKQLAGTGNGWVVGKSADTTSNTGYSLFMNQGSKVLTTYGCNPAVNSSVIASFDNVWLRLSVVFSDSVRFYANGVAYGSAALGGPAAGTEKLQLGTTQGRNAASSALQGWIDRTILADTAISRIRRNTYMISKREIPTSVRDTTSGIVWIDTAGNQCDSIAAWNATNPTRTVRLPVVAGNLYNITGAFTLDSTFADSATDTVTIAQGRQVKHRHDIDIHSRDTLRFAGVNNVGQGDSTEYVLDFFKAVNNEYYAYDTLWAATDTHNGPYKQRPYKTRSNKGKVYKQPAFKQGDAF